MLKMVVRNAKSESERELIAVFAKHNILVTPRQIRADLKKEKEKKFEDTATYLAVTKLYKAQTGKEPFYATMPQVVISGPKLSREITTPIGLPRESMDVIKHACKKPKNIKNLALFDFDGTLCSKDSFTGFIFYALSKPYYF